MDYSHFGRDVWDGKHPKILTCAIILSFILFGSIFLAPFDWDGHKIDANRNQTLTVNGKHQIKHNRTRRHVHPVNDVIFLEVGKETTFGIEVCFTGYRIDWGTCKPRQSYIECDTKGRTIKELTQKGVFVCKSECLYNDNIVAHSETTGRYGVKGGSLHAEETGRWFVAKTVHGDCVSIRITVNKVKAKDTGMWNVGFDIKGDDILIRFQVSTEPINPVINKG
ncbi:hypothetical protein DPEC_G00259700 [Dallia pectoralis]|uniref:Uncharacterized protein n=1 Tax=Dallia pectoralis TaxID=75939 RepID=A0ACC2FRH2_DALPE|nr:hypothetical protein DPEC_G00259700 [Dallia pectoralis]